MSTITKITCRVDCHNHENYHFHLYEEGSFSQQTLPIDVFVEAIEEANRFIDFFKINMSTNASRLNPSRFVNAANRAAIKKFNINDASVLQTKGSLNIGASILEIVKVF